MDYKNLLKADLRLLKRSLKESDDFEDIGKIFFDRLAMNPEFMSRGKKVSHRTLEGIMVAMYKRLFEMDVKPHMTTLYNLRRYNFFHGVSIVDGLPCTMLYFEDISMGLFIAFNPIKSGEISFIRFSATPFDPGAGAEKPRSSESKMVTPIILGPPVRD